MTGDAHGERFPKVFITLATASYHSDEDCFINGLVEFFKGSMFEDLAALRYLCAGRLSQDD